MGYRVVTVNPLKQFPIAYFGLTNVVSLDDAKGQILAKFKKMAQLKINAAEDEVAMLEKRWVDGKIQPALDLHLARQKRRQVHFNSACRLDGCGNPHRGKRVNGLERGTKTRRPGARPLFCGAHVWLRKSLTQEALNALHKSSANRIRLV